MVRLRIATDDDWFIVTKMRAPAEWFGLVAENDYMIIGLGGAFRADEGRWWATFKRVPGVRHTLTAHKAALITLDMAKAHGVDLHAIADEEISGSVVWLARLGFRATEETFNGRVVWRWVRK